ncbi:unnamed protein product [Musa textilis]
MASDMKLVIEMCCLMLDCFLHLVVNLLATMCRGRKDGTDNLQPHNLIITCLFYASICW